jgi:phage terminase large subunit GpA-like protein
MDACGDPEIPDVVAVWASQVGKTDSVLNAVGYYVHRSPSPILVTYPIVEVAESWSKDRLAPMIRDTPALTDLVSDARSRDASNTIRHKTFRGGHITAGGANSAASLASRPIRVLICDEVDAYPASAGTEGDPIKLAEKRTIAFWNAKRIKITSPRRKGSPSEKLWDRSDQRRFYVPCPKCAAYQTLRWGGDPDALGGVKWKKDAEGRHLPETAKYECEKCGSLWSDVERRRAVARGEWRATAPFRGVAGFHLNALYAPWENYTLATIVLQWIEAQGNPEELKVFVNTVLAEWWEEEGESVDETGLLKMRERWDPAFEVPDGVAVLTIGIDTQQDFFQYEVVGWGIGEESWSVRWGFLHGDPKRDARVLVALDELLARPWSSSRGPLFIRAGCVDTQGHAHQVLYKFCEPRIARPLPDGKLQFLFGTHGRSDINSAPRTVWPDKHVKARKKLLGLPFPVPIGVDAAKDQIYARLRIIEPGPGRCHWPVDRELRFFEQLTSERRVTRYAKTGRPVRGWEVKKAGRPTEALDCRVLAYGALVGLQSEDFKLDIEAEARALARRDVVRPAALPLGIPAPARRRGIRSPGFEL